MAPPSSYNLPIPIASHTWLSSSASPLIIGNNIQPPAEPPRMGRVRKLLNISTTFYFQINYNDNGALSYGLPVTFIATFQLWRGHIDSSSPSMAGSDSAGYYSAGVSMPSGWESVYASSAQVQAQVAQVVTNQVVLSTTYGVYSDFVNPIDLRNNDQLLWTMQMNGWPAAWAAPENNSYIFSATDFVMGMQPSGFLTVNETDDT